MPRSAELSDLNRSAILARIGVHGPASRADLARALDLSPAHITQLTRRLVADGLLQELDQQPTHGGRPGRPLGLVSAAGRAVGIKLAPDHLTFAEVGVDGQVVRSLTQPFDAQAPTALRALADATRTFVAAGGEEPVLGIGVGVPGTVVDLAEGVVELTQIGWHAVPLGHTLRTELGLPVLVENNVTALTLAEGLYGSAQNRDNVLVTTIGTGIGAGVVLDGMICRGHAGGVGAVGHIPVVEDGPPCQCGGRGCLEALIGEDALVRQARDVGAVSVDGGYGELVAAADRGDDLAVAIFSRAGHLFGRALAGVVHVVAPERVVLLGEGVAAWPHWEVGFEPAFRAALMPGLRALPVVVETWQDDSWAQGAACLVLATPFDSTGATGRQGELVRARMVRPAG